MFDIPQMGLEHPFLFSCILYSFQVILMFLVTLWLFQFGQTVAPKKHTNVWYLKNHIILQNYFIFEIAQICMNSASLISDDKEQKKKYSTHVPP
uniref:Uncharacterized protein n=1 Tax=Rhipicephalus zambeziensis TaxID=60191 RepID=A0A224Y924_9ACAR